MSDTKLYMAPGTCARVAAIALKEVGHGFDAELVRFMKGEHKSPEFKKLNPKGKVPTLFMDGHALTENVAIISYLNERFPQVELMPATNDPIEKSQQLADLCYCSSTLHPIVSRIRVPQFIAGEDVARTVWHTGCLAMQEPFAFIESRLSAQSWWYGEQWSAMDAYLFWVYWRVEGAGFDVDPYPHFQDHAQRMLQRSSVKEAMELEQKLQNQLKAEGLVFNPPSFK